MNPLSDNETPWWKQGNLHDKTMLEWLEASQDNKLATCLDMIVAMQEDMDTTIAYQTSDELMRYVVEMVSCMMGAIEGYQTPQDVSVADLVLNSAHALGYFSNEVSSLTH